jgi:hypothetical protein
LQIDCRQVLRAIGFSECRGICIMNGSKIYRNILGG